MESKKYIGMDVCQGMSSGGWCIQRELPKEGNLVSPLDKLIMQVPEHSGKFHNRGLTQQPSRRPFVLRCLQPIVV
jgi:hypothetical protein